MRILAVFTCFNRKEKTETCIRTITAGNPSCSFTFVAADDGSRDGTPEMLEKLQSEFEIHIVRGDGSWFYSGGMHAAMDYALEKLTMDFDYLVMLNDDVTFFTHSIEQMIRQSRQQGDAVVVGAMCDDSGSLSYGAIRYLSGYKYKKVAIADWAVPADTCNANCVLIPYQAFLEVGAMDPHYRHSLGDFDYGLCLKRAGYKLFSSREYVGSCNTNSNQGSWTDASLSLRERLKRKESVKGAPAGQWFYFLRKNFGFLTAVKGTVSPYIRILLGK